MLHLDLHEKLKAIIDWKPVENITCLSQPVQQQIFNLPIELTCIDLERQVCNRLRIFSCFCCNNYREDKVRLLKSQSQAEEHQKRYGRQQKKKIKFKISYSDRSQTKTSSIKMIYKKSHQLWKQVFLLKLVLHHNHKHN